MQLTPLLPWLWTFIAIASSTPISRQNSDPPLQTPSDMLAKGLSCPTVSKLSDLKNPILLQPGTGLSGNQSFEFGYAKIAPTLGFEPCIVATTDNLLGDAQTSVEYLIYATRQVSQYAPGGKVPIFSWSLGGPLTQWMMTFFPSTRNQVKQLIALAPDFRGANFANIANNVIIGEPSLFQQVPNSSWLTALKTHGGLDAYVPTTTIYSSDDNIVQPETGPNPSSVIGDYRNVGVKNVLVQADNVCGSGFSMDHFAGLENDITYQITKLALQSGTTADISKLFLPGITSCSKKCANPPLKQSDCDAGANIPQFLGNYLVGPHSLSEPPLRDYAK